jgi:hypothetical protein
VLFRFTECIELHWLQRLHAMHGICVPYTGCVGHMWPDQLLLVMPRRARGSGLSLCCRHSVPGSALASQYALLDVVGFTHLVMLTCAVELCTALVDAGWLWFDRTAVKTGATAEAAATRTQWIAVCQGRAHQQGHPGRCSEGEYKFSRLAKFECSCERRQIALAGSAPYI